MVLDDSKHSLIWSLMAQLLARVGVNQETRGRISVRANIFFIKKFVKCTHKTHINVSFSKLTDISNKVAKTNALTCLFLNPSVLIRQVVADAHCCKNAIYSCKLAVSQTLHTSECERCIKICSWFKNMCAAHPQFSLKIRCNRNMIHILRLFSRHNKLLFIQEKILIMLKSGGPYCNSDLMYDVAL